MRRRLHDLILLDLRMPVTDARSFRAKLLNNRSLAAVPVIIISGSPNDGSGLDLGAAAVINKPVRIDAFLKVIRQLFPRAALAT